MQVFHLGLLVFCSTQKTTTSSIWTG